ncbi:DUF3180 domain-containing protein [Micrococcus cohnii]|uniref:DUF3180 domain-containing protein n=1 Tax=Micrococcus cohnii TaxID=993416 RepID=A0A7W7M444_9MICC|nr:DUF3180 domain-containing protein [Micrococcus cohnii]MBB4736336.1 hypothetical protein [Micrococcus cohnii]
MISLRTWWLPGLGVLAGVAGWAVTHLGEGRGWGIPSLGVSGMVALAGAILACLLLGLRIRADRKKPLAQRMNGPDAARVLVLAQAGGFSGALLGGWHAGAAIAVALRPVLATAALIGPVVLAVLGLLLALTGLLVESWCRVTGGDDEDDGDTIGPGHRAEGRGVRGRPPQTEGGYAHAGDGA